MRKEGNYIAIDCFRSPTRRAALPRQEITFLNVAQRSDAGISIERDYGGSER